MRKVIPSFRRIMVGALFGAVLACSPVHTGGARAGDAGSDGSPSPAFSGPTVNGAATVDRTHTLGHLGPGFAGFSFEKTHLTDGFFTATNAPLVALFGLLGPGVVRIGANDADNATWVPSAQPVGRGQTSLDVGSADVDALADFLTATGYKAIYGVSMKAPVATAVAEVQYVAGKLGGSLQSIELGNEINLFADDSVGTPQAQWESFDTAVRAAEPRAPVAGPAAIGAVTTFTVPFVGAEGSRLTLVTQHYYKGAASDQPTIAELLAVDSNVVTDSQALAAAAQAQGIADGFRWGEMNSYSGHGAPGVSDVFASALWAIDFMFTTAEYGAAGVNFHGGGQNMDGNVCPDGAASCSRPFVYSPIDEVDSQAEGQWNPAPPYALATNGSTVSVLVPPSSAVLVHAR